MFYSFYLFYFCFKLCLLLSTDIYFIVCCYCCCCLLVFLIHFNVVVLVLLCILLYCWLSVLCCLCCHCLLGHSYLILCSAQPACIIFFCTNNATSKSVILSCTIFLCEKLRNYLIQSF